MRIFFFVHSIKMLNLSLNELIFITKNRDIKNCKIMSEEELLEVSSKPESKINFPEQNIEKIREKLN